MDFALTEDQALLTSSFEALLAGYREPPQGGHGYTAYSAQLQAAVAEAGYGDLLRSDDFGPLEAALLVAEAARCPVSVELGASLLVAPLLGEVEAPLAVAWGLGHPVRFLAEARTVCLIDGDSVCVAPVSDCAVRAASSVAAYPMAVLEAMPADARVLTGATAQAVRRRALIALAAEAAGVMRGALDLTVQYVKDRQQFGQPLGHFQAIQHRLAECAGLVRAARWLALRAADRDDLAEAQLACLYIQDGLRKLIHDCHQFHGAMGLTLEYPLHLWTYRLKILQGEAGGRAVQGRALAAHLWGEA